MTRKHDKEIERRYRDITNFVVEDCANDPAANDYDASRILTQIMYNLAHIADELRALRKVEENFLEESEESDEEEPEETEESGGEQKNEDNEKPVETKKHTCLFCGKELRNGDGGGVLILEGCIHSCICEECRVKLESIKSLLKL